MQRPILLTVPRPRGFRLRAVKATRHIGHIGPICTIIVKMMILAQNGTLEEAMWLIIGIPYEGRPVNELATSKFGDWGGYEGRSISNRQRGRKVSVPSHVTVEI